MNATQIFGAPESAPRVFFRGLLSALRLVPDPRLARSRKHPLHELLFIAVTAMICRRTNFCEMHDFGEDRRGWFLSFLELPGGVPSHDTFRRVLSILPAESLAHALSLFARMLREAGCLDVVAIDGKALRRARDLGQMVPYIVTAWSTRQHLALCQLKVRDKSNEIACIPGLLDRLDLDGALATVDAVGCQPAIAEKIRLRGGDYLLALKDNRPLVRREVEEAMLLQIRSGELKPCRKAVKDHGRLVEYSCWVSTYVDWFADRGKWRDLACFVRVRSRQWRRGPDGRTLEGDETRLYLCSRAIAPEEALRATVAHWGIENQLHWVLDVVWGEDQSRARDGFAPQNLDLLRKAALSMLRRAQAEDTPEGREPERSTTRQSNRAADCPEYLERVLSTFNAVLPLFPEAKGA